MAETTYNSNYKKREKKKSGFWNDYGSGDQKKSLVRLGDIGADALFQ